MHERDTGSEKGETTKWLRDNQGFRLCPVGSPAAEKTVMAGVAKAGPAPWFSR